MNGIKTWCRIFDAEIVRYAALAAAPDELLGVADAAAVFKDSRRDGLSAAAIETDLAAGRSKGAARDIEDTRGAQSIFRQAAQG